MFEELNQNQEKKNYTLFAVNIVTAIGKRIFKQDKALSCLSKTNVFFKNLVEIFNRLNLLGITPENFLFVVSNLPMSTDRDRLMYCAQVYELYIKVMAQNGYKIPYVSAGIKKIDINYAFNEDIKARLGLLNNVFENKKNTEFESIKSESISYCEFPDIQSECDYVINQIKKLSRIDKSIIQAGNYKDIAIFVDKSEARQKFADMLKNEGVPVVSSMYNEDYENLKHKVDVYERISAICRELHFEEFSFDSFKNIDLTANLNHISKSQKEICLEQLDDIMKSFAEEIFSDSYTIDKILNLKEKNRKSLSETMFCAFNIISDHERELLAKEFGAVKVFYEHYKEYSYAKAIGTVIMRFLSQFGEQKDLKEAVAGKIKSLNELQDLYDNVLNEKPEFSAFQEILQWLPPDAEKDANAVRLASIDSNFKENEKYKYVFVSGLTENNFPGKNLIYPFISEQTNQALKAEFQKINHYFRFFLQTDEEFFEERYFALCEVMCRTEEKIVFTTHNYEDKKSVQPSVFFKTLKNKDQANIFNPEKDDFDVTGNNKSKSYKCVKIIENKEEKCVVGQKDMLKLNASAISTFQSCPRKYYFKNLLNLKEVSNFAASYGTVVHAVFEVMNTNYLSDYSKNMAMKLGEILFNAKVDSQKVLDCGFEETYIDLICATDDLALKEMKENFKSALEDYEECGYFVQKPVKAICEKDFSFSIDELPEVVFDGRIDAILTDNANQTSIVDYKTGKDKTNSLSYAISEFGVNFKTKTGKDPSNLEVLQNSYDYQIPLYYLACQNSKSLEELKNKVSSLGLLYVRPKNRHDGCNKDFIDAKNIEFYKEQIIKNLKETVIEKIRNENEFKSSQGFGCEYCSYGFLCDGDVDDE